MRRTACAIVVVLAGATAWAQGCIVDGLGDVDRLSADPWEAQLCGEASSVGPEHEVRGRFEGRDEHVVWLAVEGEPLVWSAEVTASGAVELRYLDGGGGVSQRRAIHGAGVVRLSTLVLPPGTHRFSIVGSDVTYEARFRAGGPPTDGAGGETGRFEREPNDDPSRAHRLRPDEPWFGLLADGGDIDVYRFSLANEAFVRITVTPPAGAHIVMNVADRFDVRTAQGHTAFAGWLFAGDHLVRLRGDELSDEPYRLLFELLDPFALPDDLEPNDYPHEARPLPPDGVVQGAVGTHGDGDWFLLPPFAVTTPVTIRLEADGATLSTTIREPATSDAVATFVADYGAGHYEADVPAGGPYAVRVEGYGAYRLVLEASGVPMTARPEPLPIALSLEADDRGIAAFHDAAQRLRLTAVLRNDGRVPIDVELRDRASDHAWSVELPEALAPLEPGESRRVPLTLTVAPQARDDMPVRVTVAAASPGGAAGVSASLDVSATCGVPALDPVRAWPLPHDVLGGLNVAWTGLGATPLTEAPRELSLYDAMTSAHGGVIAERGSATTVRLTGGADPTVIAVILDPRGEGPVGAKLADFRVSTSLDGERFTLVLSERMYSVAREQAFVFDQAVSARFVRLELLSRQDAATTGPVHLGTFKVIASPMSHPLGRSLDLADRSVGGFVARSTPHLPVHALTESLALPLTRSLDAGAETASFVLAFHHTRTALVDALEWHAHPDGVAAARLDEVAVSISTGDALGPWEAIGTWRPLEAPSWTLDTPRWVRFLRFEATGLEPGRTIEYPAEIRVLEHPVGPEYRSLLGEWGHEGRAATFEWLHPLPESGISTADRADNGTRASARPLRPDETHEARVQVGEVEAWYAITVPEGDNHLRIELAGEPSVAFAFEVIDASGAPVSGDVTASSDRVVFEALVAPGEHLVRVWEPPRSVVFAWDGSGSMGLFLDAVYGAIDTYAEGVDPDRERVQLLPFEDHPVFLLPDWTGNPERLVRTLVNDDRSAASSEAEANLAFAAEALAPRDGVRAVLFVTDAVSGEPAAPSLALWRALDAARPQVFTFETSAAGTDDTQDRMQAWATGGFYQVAHTLHDLELGLARANCLLRGAKAVRIAYRSGVVAPPGPGSLVVRRPLETVAAEPAVLVIFDASGSMGALLTGGTSTRIDAAKRVLSDIVGTGLEEDTPFALRAYGHVAPLSCDTRLEVPLGPLDRAATARTLDAIVPKLLSGTPLAHSIELAALDLAEARGAVTIVLLTDGDESCGGDPEAAILTLRDGLAARGVGVSLSIVALDLEAVDTAAAMARFERWAAIGGGSVVGASSAEALHEALHTTLATATAFDVLGPEGDLVVHGVVDGDPVSLPAGAYTVRLGAGQPSHEVLIEPEVETVVTLEAP